MLIQLQFRFISFYKIIFNFNYFYKNGEESGWGTTVIEILNKVKIYDFTPLHLAVKSNKIEMVKLLLNHKDIDIHLENEKGEEPIDLATNNEIRALFK